MASPDKDKANEEPLDTPRDLKADMAESNASRVAEALVELAVEAWRFSRLAQRMLKGADAGEEQRYRGQIAWFDRKLRQSLESAGLRIVDVQGEPFDPGIAATALNLEEFGPNDRLMVDVMLEPIILGPQGIVRTGTVTVKKAEA